MFTVHVWNVSKRTLLKKTNLSTVKRNQQGQETMKHNSETEVAATAAATSTATTNKTATKEEVVEPTPRSYLAEIVSDDDNDDDDDDGTANGSVYDVPGAFAIEGPTRMNNINAIDDETVGTIQYSMGGGAGAEIPLRYQGNARRLDNENEDLEIDSNRHPVAKRVSESFYGIAVPISETEDVNEASNSSSQQKQEASPGRKQERAVTILFFIFALCAIAAVAIAFLLTNKNGNEVTSSLSPVAPVTTTTFPTTGTPQSPTGFPTLFPSMVPSSTPTSFQQQIITILSESFPSLLLPVMSDAQQQALDWMTVYYNNFPLISEEEESNETNTYALLERFVLVTVYYATNGPGWNSQDSWLTLTHVCEWFGVSCDGSTTATTEQRVVHSIRFSVTGLTGPIPTELGFLTRLNSLEISSNHLLTSSIPTEMGLLTQLTRLSLSNNDVTGSIPTEMGLLTQLTDLDLWSNSLSGSIPTEMGLLTRLMRLYLPRNHVTISIPTEMGLLSQLTQLNLSNNALSGSIPTEMGLLTQLTQLDLSYNALSDSIPTGMGLLTQLTQLDLSNNALSGSIPTEMGLLTRLTELGLSGLPNISGTIPLELAAILPDLTKCYMGGTNLTGIPMNCRRSS